MLTTLKKNPFWIAGTLVVLGFGAGFGGYHALLSATNQEPVLKGSYISRSQFEADCFPKNRLEAEYLVKNQIDSDYIKKDQLEKSYILKSELESQYVSRSQLAGEYVDKSRCMGLTADNRRDKLVGRLFKVVEIWSGLRKVPSSQCASRPDDPEISAIRADLLTYLLSLDDRYRQQAIIGFAYCSETIQEAFLLASTVRVNESSENFSAYTSGFFSIQKRQQSVDRREYIDVVSRYLLEVGAPSQLLVEFKEERY